MNLVPAKLVKYKTEDGLVEMMPDVPLGKTYLIDIDSAKKRKMTNTQFQVVHEKTLVDTYQVLPNMGVAIYTGSVILEMLELEEAA